MNRLLLPTLLASSFLVSATDWPQWRGPDRTDISKETGLLKSWPEGGPKLAWINKDVGLGYSGYAIVGGKLFTMGLRGDTELLIAVDVTTGKELWSTSVGPILKNGWGDGPRSSPTVSGDTVFALSGQGVLVAAKASDGKEVWKANLREFGGKVPGWGYTESVLVDDGKVICTPGGKDGTLLALDQATGKKVWQTADWTDGAHYSSPIVVTHGGVRQYIQLTSQHVAGVNAKDGKVLWKSEWPGKTAVIPTPIYKDGFVYISSGYGVGCKLVKLGANGTAENVWDNTNMINHHGGVILVGDKLYGYSDKGGWTCQDFKTGEVTWSAKNLGKGAIHCADGMFYCLEEGSGTVALIEVSDKGWNEKGRFKLTPQTEQRNPKGKVWTHPVVSDGKLYLRDQELLFCFDVKGK
ncbi:MAG: polyvinylalcohol dehydrogenase [Verrucomicrobia bacterium]|nr:polyvinylalcohol dehydrogenase [Verrucomicrobiota bacterium]NBU11407.1 polyvinylalcohol dehydrogenase [Pseudomonadota bacterium]NDA65331.1 polyvinylalcohol dehydrogenase [Verrucomicrobiota bacterium]NDB74169.1 polyvinylalcohol dehydrogenase [Verrucomicrobiota bacterium]NDD37081.1 polyvinylalcohol dehydrogenase [Verrucomicrobiota bacterium]